MPATAQYKKSHYPDRSLKTPKTTFCDFHPLLDEKRTTGNGFHLISRTYPSGDSEITAISLTHEDSLRKGGGAKRKNNERKEMSENVLEKSRARAKKTIRQKCKSFIADNLLTLTFRENLKDIDRAWKCFHYFSKLMRDEFGEKYMYVCVPELQKRGAIHFHLALSGYFDHKKVRPLWVRAVGTYEGNIDFAKKICDKGKVIRGTRKIANYLAKYVTKALDATGFNKRRYSSGGNIQIPPAENGWLALAINDSTHHIRVMIDVIRLLSPTKEVNTVWEAENYFQITHVST